MKFPEMNEGVVNIFYADDDADDRFLFETALNELHINCKLSAFTNGISLEEELKKTNYNCDLVFLDLNMPVRSGLDILANLQSAIQNNGLKVVVFTTSKDARLVQKTFDLNAILYVYKPNDFRELTNTLRTIISGIKQLTLPVPYQSFKFQLTYG